MKEHRLFLLLLFILCSHLVVAQSDNNVRVFGAVDDNPRKSTFFLTGVISDAEDYETIIGATVAIEQSGEGTATEIDGGYRLKLNRGANTIVISYIGYSTRTIEIEIYENAVMNLSIQKSSVDIDEVVITDNSARENIQSVAAGVERLDLETLEAKSKLLGELDVLRSIQSLSGVTSVGEGASGFNVRGGNADENLVLQDDALILNPAHTLGFFSLFHPDLISSVNLYKGDQPAYYGGRLSSVLEVNLREGSKEKFSGRGGIGMASSRLAFEGPIVKDKVSFIVGTRVSYMDWILDLVKNIDIQRSKAQFYDFTAKIDAKLSDNTNLGVSAFLSGDEFKFADQVNFEYATETATFYLNHLINDNLNLKLTANIGTYESSLFDINGLDVSKFTNKVQYLRPALRAFYQVNDKTELIMGAEMNQFTVSPGQIAPDSDESVTIAESLPDEKGVAISPFIQLKMDLTDALSIQAGLRYTRYNRVGPTTVSLYQPDQIKSSSTVIGEETFGEGDNVVGYDGLEPRVSLRYAINDQSSIKAGFNRSFQYLNQISNTSSSTPVDIWQLSDFHIRPQQAYNYSLGYFRNFNDDKITSSLTGFYRQLDKVVEYKDFATLLLNRNIETELVDAIGRSYGAEFNLEIKNDKDRFLLNYTYSRSERQVLASSTQAAVNDGTWFASNFDKPHALNVTWSKKIGRISDLSVNFTYSTGRPTTVPISSFSADNVLNIPIYSDRNAFRIPDYHRLDAAYTIGPFGKAGGRVEHNVTLSVYNLYSRENAYSVFFRQQAFSRTVSALRVAVLGAAFPAITYNFKF